ncbi:ANKRD17 [Symbiodinium sp. CCMP2592]|nr:ANKRD17 [Symbiodinium sp. CCMP2592]
MLHIWTVSGEEVVIEKDGLSDVRAVKQHLQRKRALSRFRVRLLQDGRDLHDDCAVVALPDGLQMVVLPFSEASDEQVLEFISAAGDGNLASVGEILKRPQDPNRVVADIRGFPFGRPPHHSQTALAAASDEGYVEVVRMLLEASANPDGYGVGRDYEGPSLVLAAGSGHIEVVRLLVDARALTEAVSNFWGTVVDPIVATIQGHDPVGNTGRPHGPGANSMGMVQILLEAGADPASITPALVPHNPASVDHDARPLVAASQGGHLEVARLLLESSLAGYVSATQGSANSEHMQRRHLAPALVAASSRGYVEMIRLLVQFMGSALDDCRHAMPKARTAVPWTTPLFCASRFGHVGIVSLLLGARADPDTVCGDDGLTALSVAAGDGHVEIVRLLLGS